MKKHFAVIATALALTACGGGGDDEPSKELFSLWTRDADGATFELSGLHFGPDNLINLYGKDGTRCICDMAIAGTQDSGSMAMTGCISIPYNATRQKTCEAANVTGNYTNRSAVLTLTGPNGTATFH